MLPTKSELKERYASFGDEKLMSVLYNRHEYTAEALEVAQAELDARNIGTENIRQFIETKEEKKIEREIIARVNAQISLSLKEKIFYFFAWFSPWFMPGAFQMNDAEDGYSRKLRQSKNYRIAGMCRRRDEVILWMARAKW
jgi:hypothetical protein